MKKLMLLAVGFMMLMSGQSYAGEIDLLIQKLSEKGVITPAESQELLNDTKDSVKSSIAAGTLDSIPAWVQNIKMKGDLRVRYQLNEKEGSVDRMRARLRLRLGAETRMADSFFAAFGFATGARKVVGTDVMDAEPRSTNHTFTDMFSKPSLMVDYGFIEYAPSSMVKLDMGKIRQPIWNPTDILWDTDLNPDGAALALNYSALESKLNLFLINSYFILDELSAVKSDPGIYTVQPGVSYKVFSNVNLKAACAVYRPNVKGAVLDNKSSTNSTNSAGGLKYEYNSVNPSAEVVMTGVPFVSMLGVFGDYVKSSEPDTKNKGYCFGTKFGAEKVAEIGQWQGKYMKRKLEKDSFIDTMPDSDSYGGKTKMERNEGVPGLWLARNTNIVFDWYYTRNIASSSNVFRSNGAPNSDSRLQEKILQVDIVSRF
jgi:hypothetical protein